MGSIPDLDNYLCCRCLPNSTSAHPYNFCQHVLGYRIGQLLTTGILKGLLNRQDDWAWRIPYAIQWGKVFCIEQKQRADISTLAVWPLPVICRVWFAPESPVWLVKSGRDEDARKSLRGLKSKKVSDEEIDRMLTTIQHTNEYEKTVNAGTTYIDCFRGSNRRRTEIASIVWTAQVFCGIAAMWFIFSNKQGLTRVRLSTSASGLRHSPLLVPCARGS